MSLLLLLSHSAAADGFYVASFEFTPALRYDGDPWTELRIEQATRRTGTWTEIETFTIDPVDSDPERPGSHEITTELATLPAAWYRVIALDANGAQRASDPMFVGYAIRPMVLEVANLMPDRTTIAGGAEAGTFTADTTPTATQVDALIDLVADTIDVEVLADADTETQRRWRSIIALNAAILTETSYFSHQGEINEARVGVWERMIARLDGLNDSTSGTGGGTADDDQSLQVGTVRRSLTDPWTDEIVTTVIAT